MKPRRTQRDATSAFDAIVPDLYDALLQPEMWSGVLARVAEAANVHAIQFLFADSNGRLLMSETSPLISAENHALYREHFGAIDPRRQASGTLGVDEFLLCHRICDDDFVRKSEFYNDFIIANGFRYLAGTRLLHADGYDAMFGFHKALGTDPFDDKEVEAFKTLTPHLRRIAQLKYRFATLEAKAATLSAALDLSGSAMAIVGADFAVRHVNEAAEALLRKGGGLRLRQRRLVATAGGRCSSWWRRCPRCRHSISGAPSLRSRSTSPIPMPGRRRRRRALPGCFVSRPPRRGSQHGWPTVTVSTRSPLRSGSANIRCVPSCAP